MSTYSVNGLEIYADHDRFINEVFVGNEYSYLHDYDVVLDVGANIGTFSFWIYPHAKRIYAVEPNPKAIRLLEQTVAHNSLFKIIPVETAITGSTGSRFLINTEDSVYGSGMINDSEGITVKSVTVSQFMTDHNIAYVDLLKIDVEGCEGEIFESEGFRSVAHNIGTIVGEYHTGQLGERVGRALGSCGFRYYDVTPYGSSGRFVARRL